MTDAQREQDPGHDKATARDFAAWRRGRPFFLAPIELLRDGAFAGQSLPLRVFLMMLAHADPEGNCHPQQVEIAAHLGVTGAPLSRAIDWLAERGYIKKVARHKRRWSYRITAHELLPTASQECARELPCAASLELSASGDELPPEASSKLPPEASSISIEKTKQKDQTKLPILTGASREGVELISDGQDKSTTEPQHPAHRSKNRRLRPVRFFDDDEPLDPEFYGVADELGFLSDDIEAEWQKCRDWHLSRGQGTASMKATARTWLTRAREFSPRPKAGASSASAPSIGDRLTRLRERSPVYGAPRHQQTTLGEQLATVAEVLGIPSALASHPNGVIIDQPSAPGKRGRAA